MDPYTTDLREREARHLVKRGLNRQLSGDLDAAARLYEDSLELHESAEAWCYLGWCHSFRGSLAKAVAHCRRAIALDPDFGNAYNDLGAYLVEVGRVAEAKRWFERAKQASRYETPQFPYLNLARLHISARCWTDALIELQAARLLAPGDERVDQLVAYVGHKLG